MKSEVPFSNRLNNLTIDVIAAHEECTARSVENLKSNKNGNINFTLLVRKLNK